MVRYGKLDISILVVPNISAAGPVQSAGLGGGLFDRPGGRWLRGGICVLNQKLVYFLKPIAGLGQPPFPEKWKLKKGCQMGEQL